MKKCLFYFVTLFAFAMALTACDGDDDEGTSGGQMSSKRVTQFLTSTVWHRIAETGSGMGSNSNFEYLKFTNDGKCYYSPYYKDLDDENDCKWTYNEETNMLRIYRDDGYYTYNFSLEIENNGDWVGTDVTKKYTMVVIYTPYAETSD